MRAYRLVSLLLLLLLALTGTVLLAGTGRGERAAAQAPRPLPPALPTVAPPVPLIPSPLPPPSPVRLERQNITIAIESELAITTMELSFRNPTDRPQEATLLFPIPPGAAVSDFTLTVNGETYEAEILGAGQAAGIYAEIVRRQRDPALLEYVGQGVLRARVFPVPPRDVSVLTLRFATLLVPENGALRYRLPLGVSGDTGPSVGRLTISARVSSPRGVSSLFSPTHELRVARESDTTMAGTVTETDTIARGTFELNALLAGGEVPAGLIAYRAGAEDGFFMLWLAPPLREEAVVEKDVILVLDVSGSMQGAKIEQAKAALRFVLSRLNPGDRFNVIAFSSGVNRFATALLPSTASGEGLRFVDGLRAEGGTNINDALLTALRQVDPERLTTVLFLTDGQPTVGETSVLRILDNVREATPGNTRLFVFGVGDDVNTVLLDGLAVQNRGDVQYVRPRDDVEAAVSTLYSRIQAPQLTNIQLDFGDANVHDVYPAPLPDLFGGQTLFVIGRYRNATVVNVKLSGMTREGRQTFTFENMRMAENDRQASYLPRLWASRKVGALLRDIRLRGEANSRELIDEVITLGTRYGIVTPYTSFLAIEPGAAAPPPPGGPRPLPVPFATALPSAPAAGAPAVDQAAAAGRLAGATPAPVRTPTPAATPVRTAVPAPGAPPAPVPAQPRPLETRQVADKTFVLVEGVWIDTTYQPGTETVKVPFASDAYFELILGKPDLAMYFTVGERVIVVFEGIAYEVTD